MEDDKIVTIQFKLTRNKVLVMLAAFFLCWHPRSLGSETLTLTTYYPAPYGGYSNLLTTGRTLLARDPTSTTSDSNFVGVGTNNPLVKLHVNAISGVSEIARFSATGTNNNYIRVDSGEYVGNTRVELYANTGSGAVGSYSNKPFYLRTNNQEKVGIDTSGWVAIGSPPTTWAPAQLLHTKGGNIKIETGNLIVGAPTGSVAGSGFIMGLCKTQPFSLAGRSDCPSGYERIIAVYGNSCTSGGALLSTGADMNISSNWSPHMEPNCEGNMLCCNIKDY